MKVAAQQELHVRFSLRQREYLRVEVVLVAVADKYQQGLVRQGRDQAPSTSRTAGRRVSNSMQKPVVGQKCDTHVNFLLDSQKGVGSRPALW